MTGHSCSVVSYQNKRTIGLAIGSGDIARLRRDLEIHKLLESLLLTVLVSDNPLAAVNERELCAVAKVLCHEWPHRIRCMNPDQLLAEHGIRAFDPIHRLPGFLRLVAQLVEIRHRLRHILADSVDKEHLLFFRRQLSNIDAFSLGENKNRRKGHHNPPITRIC